MDENLVRPASGGAGDRHPNAAADADARRQARRRKALETVFGARFLETFQSPYMVLEDHVIRCPVAIRLFKKDFAFLSKQLYLEYQYRGWRGFDAQLLERYASVTSGRLAAIDTLLQNNCNRLLKLLEQQGHAADLGLWPVVFSADVPIIATQARAYLDLLARIDRLYALSGTANLLGVIDSSQRAVVEFSAKKAVRALRAVLQTEVVRLYREAERVMAEQHRSGKPDARMAAVVQQQGDDIAGFDASTGDDTPEDAATSSLAVAEGEAAAEASSVAAVTSAPVRVRKARRLARSDLPVDAADAAPAPSPAAEPVAAIAP